MALIYKIQNKLNGKIYIGQTKMTLEQRLYNKWKGHFTEVEHGSKCYVHNAIRKYGKDNFTYEVIEERSKEDFSSKQELQNWLNIREAYWIEHYQSNKHEFGYNKTLGGQYKSIPDFTEFSKRRGKESKLRWENAEYRDRVVISMVKANAVKSPEAKHASAMKSVETRRANGTLCCSEEQRHKISRTVKDLWKDDEYRQRQSDNKRGNTNVKGRIHVYKENEDYRMIKPEELEDFLAKGYVKGTGRSHHRYLTDEEKQQRWQKMKERGTLDALRDVSSTVKVTKGSRHLYKDGLKKIFKKEDVEQAFNDGWMTHYDYVASGGQLLKRGSKELAVYHEPKFKLLYKDGKQKRVKLSEYKKHIEEGWQSYKEYLASGGELSWRFSKRKHEN